MPFLKFYPDDWMSDQALRKCGPATRGIFMDAICAMHKSQRPTVKGSPDELCRLLCCSPKELEFAVTELRDTKTAKIARTLGSISITSLRMKRDMKKARLCADAGRKGGGNPSLQTKNTYKGPPKLPSDIWNLSSSSSLSSPEGGAGETNGAGRGDPLPTMPVDPLQVRAIWMAYPKSGRTGFQRARLAIAAALVGIGARGEADPVAWLLGRVRAFAASPAGNAGGYTPHAPGWFEAGRYDDDPAAWERAKDTAAPDRMTPEKLDAILEARA